MVSLCYIGLKLNQIMAISYSCEFCEKEFNLQIKLKKHIQAYHASPKELDPSDFLDEEIEFTDDEKAEYYDDLKAKYDEVKSKVEFFEKRYSFMNKPPLEKLKTEFMNTKTFSSAKNRLKLNWESSNEGEVYKDPYMPENWKSTFVANSDGKKRFYFIASDGTYLPGRKPSLLHMRDVLKSPESDMILMKRGMIEEEDWFESECLPQGWLTKCFIFPGKRDDFFFTPKYELFRSKAQALKELVHEGYTNSEISNLISGFIEKSIQSNEIVWENDARIPNGWKVGSTSNRKLYVLQSGYVVSTKKTIKGHVKNSKDLDMDMKKKFLEYIDEFDDHRVKEKVGEEKDTVIHENNYSKENQINVTHIESDKWIPSEGWIRNSTGFRTLDEKNLNSAMEVVTYFRSNGYSEDYINHYKETGMSMGFKNGDDLPQGWREAVHKSQGCKGGMLTQKRFMSPNGTILQSRARAIKYMMDNDFERSDIETMFSLLKGEDGWQDDENLPAGWMKKHLKSKASYRYMAPTFETFKQKIHILKFLKRQGLSKEVLKKAENYLYSGKSAPTLNIKSSSQESSIHPSVKIKIEKEVRDKKTSLPSDGLTRDSDNRKTDSSSEANHNNATIIESDKWIPPAEWIRNSKGFRTPDGMNLHSSTQLVTYLRSNGFSEDYIDHYKEKGHTSQFKKSDALPPGWRDAIQSAEGMKGGVLTQKRFMSPNGTILQSRPLAIKYMMDNLFERSHIETMFSLLKSEDGWQNDVNLPQGWMKKQSPTTTVFMSPSVEIFKEKHAVITYMKNESFDPEVIQKTKEYLYAGRRTAALSIKSELCGDSSDAPAKKIKIEKIFDCINPKSSMAKKSTPEDLETEMTLYVPRGLTSIYRGFRTENGENLKSTLDIILYMKNNGYSNQEIDSFKERGTSTKFRKTDGLPPDWMSACFKAETKFGILNITRFLSPDGVILKNRAKAIKYMIDNGFDESDVEVMKTLLAKQDGWQVDENLPQGWMKKQHLHSTSYISPTFETFKHKHDVLDFMKSQGQDDEVVKRTEKYLYAGKSPPTLSIKREHRPSTSQESSIPQPKRIKIEKDVINWKPDSSLPSGWLSARDSDSKVHISNSKGDTFSSRIEAMRAMIETKQSPDDIFKMWKSLDVEGWVCDEGYLPPGWRRKYSDESETYAFLSPLMEVIQSSKAFLKYIENSSDYINDDIKKVKMWIKINDL